MTFIQRSKIADSPTHAESFSDPSAMLNYTLQSRPDTHGDLRLREDTDSKTFWCYMEQKGIPSYTHAIMREFELVQAGLADRCSQKGADGRSPLNWFVMASGIPGIFSYGGDLRHFAEKIQAGDHAAIRRYGHAAVKAVHRNSVAFDLPLVTIALVQGDALGGGFEHALSFDMIVAERGTKFGLPEILFNLFPGMGAYSFLSRRLDRRQTEALITSGTVHTAEQMYELGVVDVLAEPGQGEREVRSFITRNGRKHNALYATMRARRRVNPVTLEELIDVVDIWAETAMQLTAADLRRMIRLITAQDRRMAAGPVAGMVVPT